MARSTLVALLIGLMATSILAGDARVLSGVNVLRATSVAGGFTIDTTTDPTKPKFVPVMYVMTMVNVNSPNENDVVSRINGSVVTFATLPPRAVVSPRPTVDIAVVSTLEGSFGGIGKFGYIIVSRGQQIFLIDPANPTAVAVSPPFISDINGELGGNCPSINSIVVGSRKFGGKIVGLCAANGRVFTVASDKTVGTVLDSLPDPDTIGRIDVAPNNFFHNGINLGLRILAYRDVSTDPQEDHRLLAIGAIGELGGQVISIPVESDSTRLFASGVTASVRTIPPRICSYLASSSAVVASDLFIPTNNRNDLLRIPQTSSDPSFSFLNEVGQVLLWGSDGSRVEAKWDVLHPLTSPITFAQVHPITATAGLTNAANVPNGLAHCPIVQVVIQTNPTSASGNPNTGVEGASGNITFVIRSVKVGTTVVFAPQRDISPTPPLSCGAPICFGATGSEAAADCTGAQSDVNGDGVADLHCKAKARDAKIPPGATGVATFTINPPGGGW